MTRPAGSLQGSSRIREKGDDGVREENLRPGEECRAGETRADEGGRFPPQHLRVPQTEIRESREEREGNERQRQDRKGGKDRYRDPEEPREEVQNDDRREADSGAEQEVAGLFLREEIPGPAPEPFEPEEREADGGGDPDRLEPVESLDGAHGIAREGAAGVDRGGRREEQGGRQERGEAEGARGRAREAQDEEEKQRREESARGVLEKNGDAEEEIDRRERSEAEDERDRQGEQGVEP